VSRKIIEERYETDDPHREGDDLGEPQTDIGDADADTDDQPSRRAR
jgi:hypothetical protein